MLEYLWINPCASVVILNIRMVYMCFGLVAYYTIITCTGQFLMFSCLLLLKMCGMFTNFISIHLDYMRRPCACTCLLLMQVSSQLELLSEELQHMEMVTDGTKAEQLLQIHNESVMHVQNCTYEVIQRGQELAQVGWSPGGV